jgi:hypothetical protein
MIDKNNIKEGQHFWALSNGTLLIIGLLRGCFEVCGPWECGISSDDFEIVQMIDLPKGHEFTKLYYGR